MVKNLIARGELRAGEMYDNVSAPESCRLVNRVLPTNYQQPCYKLPETNNMCLISN